MTTRMGTDSESQDSDDGRRFRFEATRKDATSALQARRRKMTSLSQEISRRSRSRDRPRYDRGQEIRGDNDNNRHRSKECKSLKEELRRKDDNIRYRHMKNHFSKESRESSSRNSRSRDLRESKSSIDEKRKRSRERNRDSKNRDRYCQYSQDRGRSSRNPLRQEDQQHRVKEITRKYSRDRLEEVSEVQENQDCQNINLSDFDIVSDTEVFASENLNSKSKVKTSRRKLNQRENSDCDNHHDDSKRSAAPSDCDNDDVSDFLSASISVKSSCSYNNDNNIIINEINNRNDDGREVDALYIRKNCNDNLDDIKDPYRPILPPSSSKQCSERKIIGPSLPDHFKKRCERENSSLDEDAFGPALPPHLVNKSCEIFTRELPEKIENSDTVEHANDASNSDDDNGCIGPLPADHSALQEDLVQQQLEYRARMIKRELAEIDNNADEKKREEWMTELPSIHTANLGLGPRNFRSKPGPDMSDRSGWTDTPADRVKKRKEKMLMIGKSSKDKESTEPESTMSSKRNEISLLETHQNKIRKKKKKEERKAKEAGKLVRRPFDRDIDMQVNRFDEAKKKTLFMNAAALDERFSRGNI